jgi:hypothetical protein
MELLTRLTFGLFDPISSIPARVLQRRELEYEIEFELELEDLLTFASWREISPCSVLA